MSCLLFGKMDGISYAKGRKKVFRGAVQSELGCIMIGTEVMRGVCAIINTTLCYVQRGQQYLMLHRVKKEHDLNHDKWIGIGGKFEDKESPEECLLREAKEETGLTLTRYRYRGLVTFVSDQWPTEYMHLFTADAFEGEMTSCAEGELEWVDLDRIPRLPIWEGDRIFLMLLAAEVPFFSLKLEYRGEELVYAALNGEKLERPYERIPAKYL